MKQRILGILTALLIWMTALPAFGDVKDVTLAGDMDRSGYFSGICELEGAAYLLGNKGVYRWDYAGSEPERILDLSLNQQGGLAFTPPESKVERMLWEGGMHYLFTDGQRLYGLHPYTGQVFTIEEGGASPLACIPPDQFFYTDQEQRLAKGIESLVYSAGHLYLALSSFTMEAGDVRELFAWDLVAAQMTPMNAPGAQAAFPGPKGELLIRRAEDEDETGNALPRTAIWRYDIAAQTYLEPVWDETIEAGTGYVWKEKENALYFTGGQGRVVKVVGEGKSQVKAYLPFQFGSSQDQAFFSSGGAYVYLGAGSVFVRDVSGTGERLQSSVCINGMLDPMIAIAFSQERPDISLRIEQDRSDFLSVQESMVSANTQVDLYIVSSARAYREIREKGYAAPIEDKELIRQARCFYPAVQDALFQDGQLMAFPASFSARTWTINRTVWNRLGLGAYPRTFGDLFALMQTWNERYAETYPEYRLVETYGGLKNIVALIVKQYLLQHETEDRPVTFEDPAFREALQAALENSDMLDAQGSEGAAIIMTYPQYFGVGYNDSDEVVTVPPPALNADAPQMVEGTMELFVLNPLSKQRDAALDFLSFYAGQMSDTARYSLDPSLDVPTRPDGFKQAQEELLQRIARLEALLPTVEDIDKTDLQAEIDRERERYDRRAETNWIISQESIEIYRELAKHLVIPLKSIFTNDPLNSVNDQVIDQVIQRLVDGQLSIDQFIRELDKKAQMMFSEGA